MGTIFFTSDTHFFHANFLTFTDDAGDLIRKFADVEEMNETMVEQWNSVVRDGDKVYHLGDVTFNYGDQFRELMSRLKGSKRLLLGNHDIIKGTNLTQFFKKVQLWRIFKDEGFICTHIPMREDQRRAGCEFNVHGHLHQNRVQRYSPLIEWVEDDPYYINVCVEHTKYRPISMDEIKLEIEARRNAL